ncbi:hypothetical protein CB1_000527018 [Camelus ferus]|nr:hypothetical protein CB1_000527018 [Camelus ferus]
MAPCFATSSVTTELVLVISSAALGRQCHNCKSNETLVPLWGYLAQASAAARAQGSSRAPMAASPLVRARCSYQRPQGQGHPSSCRKPKYGTRTQATCPLSMGPTKETRRVLHRAPQTAALRQNRIILTINRYFSLRHTQTRGNPSFDYHDLETDPCVPPSAVRLYWLLTTAEVWGQPERRRRLAVTSPTAHGSPAPHRREPLETRASTLLGSRSPGPDAHGAGGQGPGFPQAGGRPADSLALTAADSRPNIKQRKTQAAALSAPHRMRPQREDSPERPSHCPKDRPLLQQTPWPDAQRGEQTGLALVTWAWWAQQKIPSALGLPQQGSL